MQLYNVFKFIVNDLYFFYEKIAGKAGKAKKIASAKALGSFVDFVMKLDFSLSI